MTLAAPSPSPTPSASVAPPPALPPAPAPRTPELLLPAGSLSHAQVALDFGADAIYAGVPGCSLRSHGQHWDAASWAAAQALVQGRGKRFYAVCNLLPHPQQLPQVLAALEPVLALRPDGVVLADPGLIAQVSTRMQRGQCPPVPIHLSAQANVTNSQTARFWARAGVRRIILSRELSLDEIEAIRQACPDVELEVLVHGALCIAYSGRCLLSGYFYRQQQAADAAVLGADFDFQREARLAEEEARSRSDCGHTPRHPAAERPYLIEELERPGQLMPILEDAHGTYILNSKDLRAVEHVARLVDVGIDALKIEGRTKSVYYVARTAQVYRQALDAAARGQPFNPQWVSELAHLAPRGYTSGFMERHAAPDWAEWEAGGPQAQPRQLVGAVQRVEAGRALVLAQTALAVGDQVEWVSPGGNQQAVVRSLHDAQEQPLARTSPPTAPGQPQPLWVGLPEDWCAAWAAHQAAFVVRLG